MYFICRQYYKRGVIQMSSEEEKCKDYAGLLALLKHDKLLSMSLYIEFKKAIIRGCNMKAEEVEKAINYADNNLNFDVSSIYWDYK